MTVKRNLPLIYVLSGVLWGRFFLPVIALFYIASEVTLEQFTIIFSAFALFTLLFEVPSGVIADLFGRKNTLLISRSLYIVEIAIVAFFNGFWMFLLAKIISGIAVSLTSGTSSALLYETLKKLNREDEHKKISGNVGFISNVSLAIVFIIGGFLFSIHYKLPALVSIPFSIVGVVLTLFIKEPYKNKHKLSFKKAISHLKEGLSLFKHSNKLKNIVFLSIPTVVAIDIVFNLSSLYFQTVKVPLYLIGFIGFIGSLLIALGSKSANILEKKLGFKKLFVLTQTFLFLSVFLMSFLTPYIGVLFYFMVPFIAGFFRVSIDHYMNKRVNSNHRATLLSIRTMFSNLGIFILFPIVGYLSKNFSLSVSFVLLAGSIFVSILFSFLTEK